jgi:hypothetical protein
MEAQEILPSNATDQPYDMLAATNIQATSTGGVELKSFKVWEINHSSDKQRSLTYWLHEKMIIKYEKVRKI